MNQTGDNMVPTTTEHFIEVWLSSVERLVWDQNVAGSNPVTSTILFGPFAQ